MDVDFEHIYQLAKAKYGKIRGLEISGYKNI